MNLGLNDRTEYVYKTTLKKTYGLTDSWIKRLGEPDKVVPNPCYRSKQSYLYLRRRVEAFIDAHQDEYDKLLEGQAARSAKMQLVADRRTQELLTWAQDSSVQVAGLPHQLDRLKQHVVNDFQTFQIFNHPNWDGEFTMSAKAIIAYVRHTLTNYEALLAEIEGKPGCHAAYQVIRARVNAIVEKELDDKYGNKWRGEVS